MSSERKLSHIDPCKVWIKSFNNSRYPFWPPPRRGPGHGRRGAAGADNGDDCVANAIQDRLDPDPDLAGAESEDDAEAVALDREVNHLLDEGLAALRSGFHKDPRGNQGDQGADDIEHVPDCPAQHSDDTSDSDSSHAAADDTMPAAHVVADPPAAGLKGKADAFFVWPGGHGIIRYYKSSQIFTAECKCGHDKCIKTRQSTAGASMSTSKNPSRNIQAKGRPLGYLGAWLLDGRNHVSKVEHWARENEILATILEKRVAARNVLKSDAEAAALLNAERPQRECEPEEPEGLA